MPTNRKENLEAFLQGNKPEIERSALHRAADWLDDWHITRILQSLGAFALILVVIGFSLDIENRKDQSKQNKLTNILAGYEILSSDYISESTFKKVIDLFHTYNETLSRVNIGPKEAEKRYKFGSVHIEKVDSQAAVFQNLELLNFVVEDSWFFSSLSNIEASKIQFEDVSLFTQIEGTEASEIKLLNSGGILNVKRSEIKELILDETTGAYFNLIDSKFISVRLKFALKPNEGESIMIMNSKISKLTLEGATESFRVSGSDIEAIQFDGFVCKSCYFDSISLKGVDLSGLVLLPENEASPHYFTNIADVSCKEFTQISGWQYAIRDEQLACGKPIPK